MRDFGLPAPPSVVTGVPTWCETASAPRPAEQPGEQEQETPSRHRQGDEPVEPACVTRGRAVFVNRDGQRATSEGADDARTECKARVYRYCNDRAAGQIRRLGRMSRTLATHEPRWHGF